MSATRDSPGTSDQRLVASGTPPLRKVFGIGLSRTGTTSLNAAFELLGFRTVHFPSDPITRREIIGHLARGAEPLRLSVLADCDALTDTPVCCVYEALDAAYPGSAFVLTVRTEEDWLRSCEQYWRRALGRRSRLRIRTALGHIRRHEQSPDFASYVRLINEHLYGGPNFDAARFAIARKRYEDGVRVHFAGRPGSLLTLDICAGHGGWPELCEFLGVETPSVPFPWVNRGAAITDRTRPRAT